MIHILWATIRPEIFKSAHYEWVKRSRDPKNIRTYVAVNWKEHADQLKEYLVNDYLITLNSNKIGVCYPSYELSSNLGSKMGTCKDDDIVIFASDDFLPPNNWDDYLIDKFKNKSGVLMVRDGYQLPDSSNMLNPAITIPIMTFESLLKLNKIIYHPIYNHMFSDTELYINALDLGILIDDRMNDETVFEHLHYAAGKRNADGADKAYNNKWQEDEITWNKRKNMTAEERIKI